SDGAVLMADAATGGSNPGLHAEAEKRAQAYDPATVAVVRGCGVAAKEALISAATAGAFGVASKGATSLAFGAIDKLAKTEQAACAIKTGLNVGMAAYQVESTLVRAADLGQQLADAYDKRSDPTAFAEALARAGVSGVSTAAEVVNLASLAGRLG